VSVSPDKSSLSKGLTYYLGDFVYIESTDETDEPMIVCIESFERYHNEDCLNGLHFFRPTETYHTPTQKFLRQEVFLTQTIERMPMNRIQGLCYVLHAKDYFKYQPMIQDRTNTSVPLPDEDVYVCESRYNMKTKTFKKIKCWNVPENKRAHLTPRETVLENIRLPSSLVNHGGNSSIAHRPSATDSESMHVDIIEKAKETVLYDSVINEKLNEHASVKRIFYEQIVTPSSSFYKVGDYVYVTNIEANNNHHGADKRFILRIEKIWKNNE
jgi:protein polybromo-1